MKKIKFFVCKDKKHSKFIIQGKTMPLDLNYKDVLVLSPDPIMYKCLICGKEYFRELKGSSLYFHESVHHDYANKGGQYHGDSFYSINLIRDKSIKEKAIGNQAR